MHLLKMLLVLLVGGCATRADRLEATLPPMVGQPVAAMVDRLGMPTSETTIMGQKVYVWTEQVQDVDYAPVLGASRMTLIPMATSGVCSIRVAVDPAGIIRRVDRQGDDGVCSGYARRMRR